jgi:hypothetical protein
VTQPNHPSNTSTRDMLSMKMISSHSVCRGISSCKNWRSVPQSIPCDPKAWLGSFFYSLAVLGLAVSKHNILSIYFVSKLSVIFFQELGFYNFARWMSHSILSTS